MRGFEEDQQPVRDSMREGERKGEKVRRQHYWVFGHPFVQAQPEVKRWVLPE